MHLPSPDVFLPSSLQPFLLSLHPKDFIKCYSYILPTIRTPVSLVNSNPDLINAKHKLTQIAYLSKLELYYLAPSLRKNKPPVERNTT